MGNAYNATTNNAMTVTPTTNINVDTNPIGQGLLAQADASNNSSSLFSASIDNIAASLLTIEHDKNSSVQTMLDSTIKVIIFLFFISLVAFKGAKQ